MIDLLILKLITKTFFEIVKCLEVCFLFVDYFTKKFPLLHRCKKSLYFLSSVIDLKLTTNSFFENVKCRSVCLSFPDSEKLPLQYSKLSIIRPGRSRLLKFEKKVVLVV